jgi:RNA polymerase sigma-70 factor (ECF subfamily)
VLELVYYHGLHYSDIATILDCPENTVKTRIFHARRKLRTVWPALTGGSTIRDNEA